MNGTSGRYLVLDAGKDKIDGGLDKLDESLATLDKLCKGLFGCEKSVKERRKENLAPSVVLLSKIWEITFPDVITCQAFSSDSNYGLPGLTGSCSWCGNWINWFWSDLGPGLQCGALRTSSSRFRW